MVILISQEELGLVLFLSGLERILLQTQWLVTGVGSERSGPKILLVGVNPLKKNNAVLFDTYTFQDAHTVVRSITRS